MAVGTNYGYANPYYYQNLNANGTKVAYSQPQSTTIPVLADSYGDNYCTDGKDDGKIGVLSAVGHAAKGVVKTGFDMIKGMFFNREGKFSLGKTLLSAGMMAACFAFPAVGVALGAVGVVMGGTKLGKGIYNAATATSDAQAKQAWEDVGGGAATLAISAKAVKSGIKSVKATSTEGALDALKTAEGKTSIKDYASALGKDIKSSTMNRFSKIGTKINNFETTKTAIEKESSVKVADAKAALEQAKESGVKETINEAAKNLESAEKAAKSPSKQAFKEMAKDTKTYKKYNTTKELVKSKLETNVENAKAALEQAKESGVKETINEAAKNLESAEKAAKSPSKQAVKEMINDTKAKKAIDEHIETRKTNKEALNSAKETLNSAKESGVEADIADAKNALDAAKQNYKNSSLKNKTSEFIKSKTPKTTEALENFQKTGDTKGLFKTVKVKIHNLKPSNFMKLYKGLNSDGKAIFEAINNNEDVSNIISKYGFEKVQDVLLYIAGAEVAANNI